MKLDTFMISQYTRLPMTRMDIGMDQMHKNNEERLDKEKERDDEARIPLAFSSAVPGAQLENFSGAFASRTPK